MWQLLAVGYPTRLQSYIDSSSSEWSGRSKKEGKRETDRERERESKLLKCVATWPPVLKTLWAQSFYCIYKPQPPCRFSSSIVCVCRPVCVCVLSLFLGSLIAFTGAYIQSGIYSLGIFGNFEKWIHTVRSDVVLYCHIKSVFIAYFS